MENSAKNGEGKTLTELFEQGATEAGLTEEQAQAAAMKILAEKIWSNRDLTNFLRHVDPKMREEMYKALKPYLKFKALSYTLVKP